MKMILRPQYRRLALLVAEAAGSVRVRGAALHEAYRQLSFFQKLGAWGSAASIVALTLAVSSRGGRQSLGTHGPESLHTKLAEYLQELDSIEANWDKDYGRVEPLANRALSLLRTDYPESAKAISSARESALAAEEIAHVLRQEIQGVLDQLATDTR